MLRESILRPPHVLKFVTPTNVKTECLAIEMHNGFRTQWHIQRKPWIQHISIDSVLVLDITVHFYSYTCYELLHRRRVLQNNHPQVPKFVTRVAIQMHNVLGN